MGTDLEEYIEMLELIAFFAGFPLVYLLVHAFADQPKKPAVFFKKLAYLLPFSYALVGTLYFLFLIKNLYEEYSLRNNLHAFANPWLIIWALSSLLMWSALFRRKAYFSFLHSLVIFFLLLRDVFLYATDNLGKPMLVNDMKLYSGSLILNSGCLLLTYILYLIIKHYPKYFGVKQSQRADEL